MTEEQCLRPSDGNKRKRITGWLAGHEIHLEIEDVLDKNKNKNTLGCSVLKFSPNIFLIKPCYQALGQVCKFVLRCKKSYRIGPWIQILVGSIVSTPVILKYKK